MQVLASKLIGRWLIDRAHARPLGEVSQLVLDPTNLKLVYYQVAVPGESQPFILRADQANLQESLLTVASEAALGQREDFVRDQALLEKPCQLVGWRVIDRAKNKIGRINDYSLSTTSLKVDRLMVAVPFFQRFFTPERIITSSHIHDVQPANKLIVIKDNTQSNRGRAAEAVPA